MVGDGDGPYWAHTHGLRKFGRPELEMFDLPRALGSGAMAALNAFGQYVADGALIGPGHTVGATGAPLRAVVGTRELDHWGDTSVLELVDVDSDGRPTRGAPRGLAAWLAS